MPCGCRGQLPLTPEQEAAQAERQAAILAARAEKARLRMEKIELRKNMRARRLGQA